MPVKPYRPGPAGRDSTRNTHATSSYYRRPHRRMYRTSTPQARIGCSPDASWVVRCTRLGAVLTGWLSLASASLTAIGSFGAGQMISSSTGARSAECGCLAVTRRAKPASVIVRLGPHSRSRTASGTRPATTTCCRFLGRCGARLTRRASVANWTMYWNCSLDERALDTGTHRLLDGRIVLFTTRRRRGRFPMVRSGDVVPYPAERVAG